MQAIFTQGTRSDNYYLNLYKQDSDNDGVSDALEIALGTDPKNSASLPLMKAIVATQDKSANLISAKEVYMLPTLNDDGVITYKASKEVKDITGLINLNTLNNFAQLLNHKTIINGTDGNDQLIGSEGNDIIRGGKGYDLLQGNGGKDIFVFFSK